MERVLLVGIFICVTGAVYTGLSIDELNGIAPLVALSAAGLILVILALVKVFKKRG